MSNVDAQNGDQIKSQTLFANYSTNLHWDGSLIYGNGFNNSEMYMMKLANANTLSYSGSKLIPENIEIQIKNGWNWIGFTPNSNMYLNDAFAFYDVAQDDIIKSQYQFAMYDQSLGWIGNLTYLVPGLGYMYKTTNNESIFTYPNNGYKANIVGNGYEPAKETPWNLMEKNYQNNMSLVAVLDIPAEITLSDNIYIAAFVDNTCRGIVKPIISNDNKLFFVTIYGSEIENVDFKLFDKEQNIIYNIVESLTFAVNDVIGTTTNPYVLHLTNSTSIATNEDMQINIKTYPNPFTTNLTVVYNLQTSEDLTIELYDVLGRKIKTISSDNKSAGLHSFNVDGSKLSQGTYIIKFITTSFTEQVNIIKQ
jgi:hypothetical protein